MASAQYLMTESTSSARASFALYNTEGEADAFVDALTRTQAFFA